jgi:hypothetical protein
LELSIVVNDADTRRILAYRPDDLEESTCQLIRPGVVTLVSAAVGHVPYQAGALMSAVTKLGAWAVAGGLPPDSGEWIRTTVVDRFVITAGMAQRSATTYRSVLGRVAEIAGDARPGRAAAVGPAYRTAALAAL